MSNALHDRNLLLSYVLKTYPKVVLPSGITELSPKHLEQIPVAKILEMIEKQEEIFLEAFIQPNVDHVVDSKTKVPPPRPTMPKPKLRKPLPVIPKSEQATPPKNETEKVQPTESKTSSSSPLEQLEETKEMPLEEMLQHVTREIEYNKLKSYEQPHKFIDLAWEMSDEDVKIAAYESLLLCTNFLTELKKEEVETTITVIRDFMDISTEMHSIIFNNLLMYNESRNIVCTSGNIKEFMERIQFPITKIPRECLDGSTKSLLYRWELIKFNKEKNSKEWKKSMFRHAQVVFNGIVFLIRTKDVKQWKFQDKEYTPEQFENFLFDHFKQLVNEKITTNEFTELCTLLDNAISMIVKQLELPLLVPHVYPLNVVLYEPLIDCTIHQRIEDEEEGEDSTDSVLDILTVLTFVRKAFGISTTLESLCYTYSVIEFSHCGDAKLMSYAEQWIIEEISKLETDGLQTIEKKHVTFILAHVMITFGNRLCDYLDNYSYDLNHLKIQLKAFSIALEKWKKLNKGSTASMNELVKYMINLTVSKNYKRLKGDKELSLENISEFCNNFKEEIKNDAELISPILQPYYEDARKHSAIQMLKHFVKDICVLASKQTELSKELLDLLSFLKDIIQETGTAVNVWDNLKVLMEIIRPHLDKWINHIQFTFSEYLERSIKLEKWEPATETARHSASVIDLFSFLEETRPFLFHMVLPDISVYYRAYAQCASGLVQKYGMAMVEGIPDPKDIIPQLPRMTSKKLHKKILRSLEGSSEKIKSQEAMAEERRLQLGNKFSYENLYIRLNNLACCRRRFIALMESMDKEWKTMRQKLFGNGSNNQETTKSGDVDEYDKEDEEDNQSEQEQAEKKSEDISKGLLADVDFENIKYHTSMFLMKLIKDLCKFIGSRNVFIELQGPMFDQLYIPSVRACTLTSKMEQYLRTFLESTCELVTDNICVNIVIKETYCFLVIALSMTILDGGPKRIFQPEDAQLLLKDIRALENFFYADGQGIRSYEFVQRTTAKIKAIVGLVMEKPSKELAETFPKLPNVSKTSPFSKQIVYKVLYHRNDSIAKAFCKKHDYKYG